LLTASNYTANWDSFRAGLNYFVHEYTVRFSADGTFNANVYVIPGAWENVGRS
jgi:hypothetical protein